MKTGSAFAYQTPIQNFFHPPVDIIGKTPHIETFDISCCLNNGNGYHISTHQNPHIRECAASIQDIHQTSRHLSLKPGPCQKSDIIDQP